MLTGISIILALLLTPASSEGAPTDPRLSGDGLPISGYQKGFFIHSAERDFTLHFGLLSQIRFETAARSDDLDTITRSELMLSRMRFRWHGHAFDPRLRYSMLVQTGVAGTTLLDGNLDWQAIDGRLYARVGRWPRPFSRQRITSITRQELSDRAITDRGFLAGRDIGFALHNGYDRAPELEWALGIFNGRGDRDVTARVTSIVEPMLLLRVAYNYGRIAAYSEGDLEGGGLRFSVGVAGSAELDRDDDGDAATRATLDGIVKFRGLAATGAIFVSGEQDGPGFRDQSFEQLGFHGQASYVIADALLPAVRYARVTDDGRNDDVDEVAVAVSTLFWDHRFKLTVELAGVTEQAPGKDITLYRGRVQVQMVL